MKMLKKLLVRLVILVVLVAVLAWLGRNRIVMMAIPTATRSAAKLSVGVGKVEIAGNLSSVCLNDLTLRNPEGFPDDVMLRIPEVYAKVAPLSLLTDTLHMREVRLNVGELVIVRNKDGKFNVMALTPPRKDQPAPGGPKSEPSASRGIKIDMLDVRIGTLRFIDCTKNPQTEKTVNLDTHDQCKDVTSPAVIGGYIVLKAAGKGVLMGMTELAPLLAGGAFDGVTGEAGKVLEGVAGEAGKVLDGFLKSVK